MTQTQHDKSSHTKCHLGSILCGYLQKVHLGSAVNNHPNNNPNKILPEYGWTPQSTSMSHDFTCFDMWLQISSSNVAHQF